MIMPESIMLRKLCSYLLAMPFGIAPILCYTPQSIMLVIIHKTYPQLLLVS